MNNLESPLERMTGRMGYGTHIDAFRESHHYVACAYAVYVLTILLKRGVNRNNVIQLVRELKGLVDQHEHPSKDKQ